MLSKEKLVIIVLLSSVYPSKSPAAIHSIGEGLKLTVSAVVVRKQETLSSSILLSPWQGVDDVSTARLLENNGETLNTRYLASRLYKLHSGGRTLL